MNSDLVKDILMQAADPILPGFCLSQGRLNLYNAVDLITSSRGYISLDQQYYSCSAIVTVFLADYDLLDKNCQEVTLMTSGGDLETLVLRKTSGVLDVFTGTISTTSASKKHRHPSKRPKVRRRDIKDGLLQVSDGEIIAVTYIDEDDGTANPATATDTAVIDCEGPVIFDVEIDVPGPEPTVTCETNETAAIRLLCGPACGQPYTIEKTSSTLATRHTIKLTGVSPETDYFFIIEATDIVGNTTVDDNDDECYTFTTTAPGDIYVPSQCDTIQKAIDYSWNGGMVWVAEGVYSGQGNCDIDFKARAITLKSENGPNNTIIDCQGSRTEPHRAFYFYRGEDANSIVDGFTITNGYVIWSSPEGAFGGGVYCNTSSPTIKNCRITKNTAEYGAGGAICCVNSDLTISNCTVSGNRAMGAGGIYCISNSNPKIINTIISGNIGQDQSGGGLYADNSNPTITNSIIICNWANWYGGGLRCYNYSDATVTNCIIWGNKAISGGSQIAPVNFSTVTMSFSDIQDKKDIEDNDAINVDCGNIDVDPCFIEMGRWANIYDVNITVEPDNHDAIWLDGDYHLRSEGWRWDGVINQWAWDDVTSRCIDAGNPGSALGDESVTLDADPLNRFGQNLRINVGAFGGKEQASMPPYDWTILSDLTNDGTVDFADLGHWAENWLSYSGESFGDLDRNGIVDMVDFAMLAKDWISKTSWHVP